jgi:hypothetical protein
MCVYTHAHTHTHTHTYTHRPYILRVTNEEESVEWCAAVDSFAIRARKRALAGEYSDQCL